MLAGLVELEQPQQQQQQQGRNTLDLLVAAAWEAQQSEKQEAAAEDSDTTLSDDSEEDEGMGLSMKRKRICLMTMQRKGNYQGTPTRKVAQQAALTGSVSSSHAEILLTHGRRIT